MNTSGSTDHISETGTVSQAELNTYGVVLSVVSSLVCSFGVIANIINIIVFLKQGVTDTVTTTLLALSVSDLGAVAFYFGVGMCFSPLVVTSQTVNTSHLSYMFGWSHITFSRISCGLTVFISFERCLCIALPLKVKSIITMRRTVIILVVITLIMVTSVAPVFYSSRMAWVFFPETNRTVLSLVFTPDRDLVDAISFGVNTVVLVPGTLIMMVILTVILVVQLNRKAKWRDSVASAGKTTTTISEVDNANDAGSKPKAKSGSMSNKDRKVVKMVVIISSIAVACYIPNLANTIVALVIPEFNYGRREQNLLSVTGTFGLFLQAINSTVNIFVYLKMSSKYKSTFSELTSMCKVNAS